ncbi:MAG: DMT family transporter [Litorivicinaceae bacterium]
MSENLRCILFMTAAMAGFAIEDAVIKHLSDSLPISQILVGVGACGAIVFAVTARLQGVSVWLPAMQTWGFWIRTFSELAAAVLFVSAMVYGSLSTASAILQATPLAVACGAALYLKQRISIRQWSLIGFGFVGVLMVIQPGGDEFQPAAILAVIGVLFLALRDVITRSLSAALPTATISMWAFSAVLGAGVLSAPVFGPFVSLDWTHLAWFAVSAGAGCAGYFSVVIATRSGDVAVVAPFRYSRLLFALALSVLLFNEAPNQWVYLGAGFIVVSGALTLITQRKPRPLDPGLAV